MRTLCAAALATVLGACTVGHLEYEPIERIVAHPQNYHGCEIKVRGDPVVLGMTMPGDGKKDVMFAIREDDGSQLRFSKTIDSVWAEKMRKDFSDDRKYVFTGVYRDNAFHAVRIEHRGRLYYEFPQDKRS